MAEGRPIRDLLDRCGPDFSSWRDQERATQARRAILASREDRADWERARSLDTLLRAHERGARENLAAGPLPARVEAGVLRTLQHRPARTRSDVGAIAAAVILCAFLGGAASGVIADRVMDRLTERPATLAYSVDGLVFGDPEADGWP